MWGIDIEYARTLYLFVFLSYKYNNIHFRILRIRNFCIEHYVNILIAVNQFTFYSFVTILSLLSEIHAW